MPTPEEIRDYHALRGRFLSELWDAEGRPNPQAPWIPALDVLTAIGAERQPPSVVGRLVRDLVEDGLVRGGPAVDDEQHPSDLRLTSRGRLMVERWVASDEPTEYLQLSHSQAVAASIRPDPVEPLVEPPVERPVEPPVEAPVAAGHSDTRANRQEALGADLVRLIGLATELLQDASPAGRAREAIEADIEVLQKQYADLSSRPARIRSALSRLAVWAGEVAALGASATVSRQVEELARHVIEEL